MKIISFREKEFKKNLFEIYQHNLESSNEFIEICSDLKKHGNQTISKYLQEKYAENKKFSDFKINELPDPLKILSVSQSKAIEIKIENINNFIFKGNKSDRDSSSSPREGVILRKKSIPQKKIGIIISGKSIHSISTSIQIITLAKEAGVKEIVVNIDENDNFSYLSASLIKAGATELYTIDATASLLIFAHGTKDFSKVDSCFIVSNNNISINDYRYLGNSFDIPIYIYSQRVCFLADSSSNPDFIVGDILSYTEHKNPHDKIILISTSFAIIERIKNLLDINVKDCQEYEIIKEYIDNNIVFVEAESIEAATIILNKLEPSKLILMSTDKEKIIACMTFSCSILLGDYTTDSLCDTLLEIAPVFISLDFKYHPISTDTFLKKITIAEYSKHALEKEIYNVDKYIEIEKLPLHAKSIFKRFFDYYK